MAKYKLTNDVRIDNVIRKSGEIVELANPEEFLIKDGHIEPIEIKEEKKKR